MGAQLRLAALVGAIGVTVCACGGTTQWREAYAALGADPRASSGRDHDRVRLANAEIESEPPKGLGAGARIHSPGTLAHLKYQTFDADGAPLDSWEVRALVPPLPAIERHTNQATPLVEASTCSGECGERGRTGLVMTHSGDPGLSPEWVLRMPVGRTFDLGPRTMAMQDLLGAPRRVSLVSRRDGDRWIAEPTNIQVTLQAVCAAKVRVGSFTRFETNPNYVVPFPEGFRTYRWVQLDGCGHLDPLAVTTPPPPPMPHVARAIPEPAGDTSHSILTVRRDPAQGFAQLLIDEAWLQREGIPRTIKVNATCRYDSTANAWQPAPATDARGSLRVMVRGPGEEGKSPRVLALLPREVGLYWVQWSEALKDKEGNDLRSAREAAVKLHDALVPSGPIMCNDLDIGQPPAGSVVACVPLPDRAQARFVPQPNERCGR